MFGLWIEDLMNTILTSYIQKYDQVCSQVPV